MRNILITSSENQSELFQFLNEIQPGISEMIDENTIKIHKNKHDDDINTALAIYILNLLHKKLITKVSGYLNNEVDVDLIKRLCSFERYSIYIEPLKVLLKQHFKGNNTITLESFIKFNCRGLEKEIHRIGQDCIAVHIAEADNNNSIFKKTMDNQNNSTIDMIDSSITYQDYLKRLNELFIEINSEIEFLESATSIDNVHIKQVNGRVSLVDENDVNIERTIDEYTGFPISEEIEGINETLRLTVVLLACIVILKTKTIVFHKSADKNIITQIIVYLSDSRNYNSIIDTVNLFKCDGCDFC